jgi:hypothetical protein
MKNQLQYMRNQSFLYVPVLNSVTVRYENANLLGDAVEITGGSKLLKNADRILQTFGVIHCL